MFNSRSYENSRPDGIPVLEIAGEESGEPARRLFVPLKRTELRGEVAGPLADLRLVQTFGYARAQSDKVLEAVYRFPLPGDAAVTGVTVRFGDTEIKAELQARDKAEAAYKEAKDKGQQAALATRESPDVFTLQVAGLQPDQQVTVETHYVQLARADSGGWSIRIPLTTSPRYVRSDEAGSRHAQGQPLALLRDPGHRFSLDLTIQGAGTVSSPTHTLATEAGESSIRVQLRDGEVLPDRDCVLRWTPEAARTRAALTVLESRPDRAGPVYFLAMAAPPSERPAGPAAAREAILLVDHSGSMSGAKWEAADWAVRQFLAGLTERDTFALGLFHNETTWYAPSPRAATPDEIAKAVTFLDEHKDSGGTELGVALEQALALPRGAGEIARHVLIVTDAEVSDAGRILRLADEESRLAARRRISVLCIDAAPNSFLASELAERGGGVSRFLTSAPEEEDITTALDQVLTDWAEPVLTGLRLEVDRSGVEAAGRALVPAGSGSSAIDLGDLPMGRAVWVCGRALAGTGPIGYRLITADGREHASATGQPTQAAISALFGAGRVAGLEYAITSGLEGKELSEQLSRLGYDEAQVQRPTRRRLYAENARKDAEKAVRGLLVREALRYGLASSETAFVAVRKEKGQPVAGTVAVANALPAGWSDDFALGPQAQATTYYMKRQTRFAMPSPMAAGAPAPFASAPPAMYMRLDADAAPLVEPAPSTVYAGRPVTTAGERVLLDTTVKADAARLKQTGTISELRLEFRGAAPSAGDLDRGLQLLLFVDDLASPRARVRLADLVRQGLKRPLNAARQAGQVVRIVLADPNGAWTAGAPEIGIVLVWG